MNTSRLPLPRLYLVTPEPGNRLTDFVQHLEHSLIAGIRLVQFRAKTLEPAAYEKLAIEVLACCRQYDALLLLNADPQLVDAIGADGVHLDGMRLAACQNRPLAASKLVSAACHSLEQLKKAETIAADMAIVSPVLPTASHPEAPLLGWEGFRALAVQTTLPVYALGGMNTSLLENARQNGAYGVAGIQAFWGGSKNT